MKGLLPRLSGRVCFTNFLKSVPTRSTLVDVELPEQKLRSPWSVLYMKYSENCLIAAILLSADQYPVC